MAAIEVLAIDIGASSGRGVAVSLTGETLALREVGRFENGALLQNGAYIWDIERIFEACRKLIADADGCISAGIDTWGVDYALIDASGARIGEVMHYRNAENAEKRRRVLQTFSHSALYAKTGIQDQTFNTVYQLQGAALREGLRLLLVPDYLNFRLTGVCATEYSIASTTGLLDCSTRTWCWDVIDALGYPRALFGAVHAPGMRLGAPKRELALPEMQIVSVAAHDTASAFLAATHADDGFALLVSGTWSLMGTELDAPILSEAARRANFTNEGGAGGTIRFLKNIMGTWILQQLRRQSGKEFAEISAAARAWRGDVPRIDVDDARFLGFDDVAASVRAICRETGQTPPQEFGALCRTIYAALAKKYRETFLALSRLTGRQFRGLQIVGGGIRDAFLCQLTADACGVPVLAGPLEASVIGNAMMQFCAAGACGSIRAARAITRNLTKYAEYFPKTER